MSGLVDAVGQLAFGAMLVGAALLVREMPAWWRVWQWRRRHESVVSWRLAREWAEHDCQDDS